LNPNLICDYGGSRMGERLSRPPASVSDGRRDWWVGEDGRFHDIRPIRRFNLPGGIGDYSSFIPNEDADRLPKSQRTNGQLPDEELARPLIGLGKPNPTL